MQALVKTYPVVCSCMVLPVMVQATTTPINHRCVAFRSSAYFQLSNPAAILMSFRSMK